MVAPGPSSINDFKALPNAEKSTLSGDTVEVPNIVGFFSNNYRDFVVDFYVENYQQEALFPFSPIRLNYPPEFAFTAIKDQTHSTFLEEVTYPLRDSLFINGLEPFYEDGKPKYEGASRFMEDRYGTKTTLRFYPTPFWVRIATWVGITLSLFFLLKLGRKILF